MTQDDTEECNTFAFYINNSGSIQSQAKQMIQPATKRNEDIISIAMHYDKSKELAQNNLSTKKKLVQDPEQIYCNYAVKNTKSTVIQEVKLKESKVNFITFLFSLNSVWNSLPLSYSNIEIMGKSNILSQKFLQESIITPLKKSNPQILEDRIEKSKVIYCCENLTKKLKKVALFTAAITLLWVSIMFICEYLYINSIQGSESFQKLIIYSLVISCAQFISNQAFILIGMTKCISRPFILSLTVISTIILYQLFIAAFSIYSNQTNTSEDDSSLIGIHIWVSISSIFVSFTLLIFSSQAYSSLKRLFVLVKQLNPEEIPKGWII